MQNQFSSHPALSLPFSQICSNRGWFYLIYFFEWMDGLEAAGFVSAGIYILWTLVVCRVRHICLVRSGSATFLLVTPLLIYLLNLSWSCRRPGMAFRLREFAVHLLGVPASAAPPGFWETLTIANPGSGQHRSSLTVAFANRRDGSTTFAWTWASSVVFERMSSSPTLRSRRQRPACSVVSVRGRRYHLRRFQHPENRPVGYRSQDADAFLALLSHSGNLQWPNSSFLLLGCSSGSSTSQLIASLDGSWHFDSTPPLLLIP